MYTPFLWTAFGILQGGQKYQIGNLDTSQSLMNLFLLLG